MPGSAIARRLRSDRFEVYDWSMAPTFLPGDRILVDRAAFRHRAPHVGEVVVLHDPERPGRLLLKRIAVVGPVPDSPLGPGTPADHVRVLSDDSHRGRDSRRFGPVPRGEIVGSAWFRYAPPTRRGPLGP